MKKKGLIIIVAIVAIVAVVAISLGSSYNGFVKSEERISTAAANLDTQLQRRADLIPNLVNSVEGYANYEKSTLTAVTKARANVKTSKGLEETEEASAQLDEALNVWVNAITEAYPELKSNEQFTALQDNLSGTESRISTARKDYNEAVEAYNIKVRSFPGNILASIFGFEKVEKFEADDSANQVPEVDIDLYE